MGDSGQGSVLSNQVQAVKAGAGISIAANGIITVDSQTVVGVMKLGQTLAAATTAYNGYNWPTTTGTAGQQITIASVAGGITTLAWDDPDQIPWTAKGQLVVGTGVNTQTILNVGTDGQILIGDSASASGLSYSSNYVSTSGATGAANLPAGTTAQRPATPPSGGTRYNSTTTSLEFWNGSAWESVASSSTNSFVEKTSDTGSAVMPAGTTAQRDAAPTAGFMRFNDTTDLIEFWNGVSWQSVSSSASGSFVAQTVPTAGTPSAVIPVGTTAQRQTLPAPTAGFLRFNTTYDPDSLEVYNGTTWGQLAYVPDLGTLTDLIPANGAVLPGSGTYENITINAGVTVTVSGASSLTARGTVTINGTINGDSLGLPGGSSAFAAGAGVSGSRGQGLGSATQPYGFSAYQLGSSGQSGGASVGVGAAGFSGSGGSAGATLIIQSQGPIVMGGSAIITARGQSANAATVVTPGSLSIGGSGGGSGGLIVLQSQTSLTLTAGATLSVNGGNGSAGAYGVGTNGNGASGGGGGAGGFIVLNSPVTTDASTKIVTGGSAGVNISTATSTAFSGPGAGFGGAGGTGSNAGAAAAGGAGQIILNSYL